MSIAARDYGGGGRPVVYLHGQFGNLLASEGIAAQLRDSYRVVALDLRCHGRSDAPFEFSYETCADDVRALVAELGLGVPIVIGDSLGAPIAIAFAAAHSCRGVIANDNLIQRHEDDPMMPRSTRDDYLDWTRNLDWSSTRMVADEAEALAVNAALIQGLPESRRDWGHRYVLRNYHRVAGGLRRQPSKDDSIRLADQSWATDIGALLTRLRTPTLIVTGIRKEPAVLAARRAAIERLRALNLLIEAAEVDANHTGTPEQLIEVARPFLARLSAHD